MDALKDFLKPELIWFLVGLILLISELVMPGLIVAFFGIGAWVVAVICLFADISLNTQLLIFIVSSVLSLLLLRKWLKGVFLGHIVSKQNIRQNLEDFVGRRAVVKERIVPHGRGKVEFRGTDWQAEADEEIEKGTPVEIIEKDNITLKVKAL